MCEKLMLANLAVLKTAFLTIVIADELAWNRAKNLMFAAAWGKVHVTILLSSV